MIMLDTIHIWLDRDSVGKVDWLAEIPWHLENVAEHFRDNQVSISGNLKNLRLSLT